MFFSACLSAQISYYSSYIIFKVITQLHIFSSKFYKRFTSFLPSKICYAIERENNKSENDSENHGLMKNENDIITKIIGQRKNENDTKTIKIEEKR